MSISICQQCNRSVSAGEQMYQMGDLIVCPSCAGVVSAESELAAAAIASRRKGVRRPAKKKSGSAAVGVAAFVIAMLAVTGGIAYFTWNGTIVDVLQEQKKSLSGEDAVNALIDQYNALVADGNKLATERKYAEAAQKLREARAVAQASEKAKQAVDLAKLETVITYYETLASGNTPSAPAPTAVSPAAPVVESPSAPVPTPDNVRFMEKRPGDRSTTASSNVPRFDAVPEPAAQSGEPKKVAGDEKPKPPASGDPKDHTIDAYKVPK